MQVYQNRGSGQQNSSLYYAEYLQLVRLGS
jgi:hypothetical protein